MNGAREGSSVSGPGGCELSALFQFVGPAPPESGSAS